MKSISHTENVYGVFGDLKKTIIYYTDGTKRVIIPKIKKSKN